MARANATQRGSDTTPSYEPSQREQGDAGPSGEPALDAWLRERLGRRIIVALLAPAGTDAAALEHVRQEVMRYQEVWLVIPGVADSQAQPGQLARQAAEIAARDADAVLVIAPAQQDAGRWPAEALAACEQAGLRDRAFVALVAPGEAFRAGARALGFEDGFALDTPIAELVAALAREAVAHDELLRRGSSPPCYL